MWWECVWWEWDRVTELCVSDVVDNGEVRPRRWWWQRERGGQGEEMTVAKGEQRQRRGGQKVNVRDGDGGTM